MSTMKTIGVKFKQKSKDKEYHDKVYYYKTDKDVKKGQMLDVKVPSGGSPDALVVSVDKGVTKKKLKKWEK